MYMISLMIEIMDTLTLTVKIVTTFWGGWEVYSNQDAT